MPTLKLKVQWLDERGEPTTFAHVLEVAHIAARQAQAGMVEGIGLDCGFAWVTISGWHPLARWCRKAMAEAPGATRSFYGDKGYPKGHQWWEAGRLRRAVDRDPRGRRASVPRRAGQLQHRGHRRVEVRLMAERDIAKACRKRWDDLGLLWRRIEYIGRRGAPDFIVLPPTEAGRSWLPNGPTVIIGNTPQNFPPSCAWVETKPDGKTEPEPHQLREHARLRAAGQVVLVIGTIEELDRWFPL
jgi:hypothetical protein